MSMATPTVKSTYSLDLETIRALERMAARWKVSKSEALRRAIRMAEHEAEEDPLEALDRVQRSLALTPERTREWVRAVRTERRAASTRRERR